MGKERIAREREGVPAREIESQIGQRVSVRGEGGIQVTYAGAVTEVGKRAGEVNAMAMRGGPNAAREH